MEDDARILRSANGASGSDAKIGPILAQARKDRGLSLEEAEQATKIRKRYLDGLEREDYAVLPDGVYARGFLKTYANYLGLDGEELSRQLRDRRRPRRERGAGYNAPKQSTFDHPLVNPGELFEKRRPRISWGAVLNLVVALLLLAGVVGGLYFVGLGAQSTGQGEDAPQPAAQVPANGAEGGPQGAAAPPPGVQGNGPPERPQPPPPPDTLTVALSVRGDPSWLSVLVDGELVYEQIAEPGFFRTFQAERDVSIKTGNAGAVGVVVNGQDQGALGESGEVLTRDFSLRSAS